VKWQNDKVLIQLSGAFFSPSFTISFLWVVVDMVVWFLQVLEHEVIDYSFSLVL